MHNAPLPFPALQSSSQGRADPCAGLRKLLVSTKNFEKEINSPDAYETRGRIQEIFQVEMSNGANDGTVAFTIAPVLAANLVPGLMQRCNVPPCLRISADPD